MPDDPPKLTTKPGTVSVTETGQGKFQNQVSFGGEHTLIADEPQSSGGTDTGPNPYDLLLAALGTCKVMTMRMYANNKGYPLERTQVTLSHNKIHASDCENCETKEGNIDQIEVKVEIFGDMDEKIRMKIAKISERCPVHRSLISEINIKTSFD